MRKKQIVKEIEDMNKQFNNFWNPILDEMRQHPEKFNISINDLLNEDNKIK